MNMNKLQDNEHKLAHLLRPRSAPSPSIHSLDRLRQLPAISPKRRKRKVEEDEALLRKLTQPLQERAPKEDEIMYSPLAQNHMRREVRNRQSSNASSEDGFDETASIFSSDSPPKAPKLGLPRFLERKEDAPLNGMTKTLQNLRNELLQSRSRLLEIDQRVASIESSLPIDSPPEPGPEMPQHEIVVEYTLSRLKRFALSVGSMVVVLCCVAYYRMWVNVVNELSRVF